MNHFLKSRDSLKAWEMTRQHDLIIYYGKTSDGTYRYDKNDSNSFNNVSVECQLYAYQYN